MVNHSSSFEMFPSQTAIRLPWKSIFWPANTEGRAALIGPRSFRTLAPGKPEVAIWSLKTTTSLPIEGELPGGGHLTVQCRVAAIVPFLVMKGMALADRLKEKDAYDIYYCVRRYPGGLAALADAFRPHIGNGLVREGLAKIREKFLSPEHAGPKWVADFLEIIDPEERAIQQRAAYEQITALLQKLGCECCVP